MHLSSLIVCVLSLEAPYLNQLHSVVDGPVEINTEEKLDL
jgi:hypothetical protein